LTYLQRLTFIISIGVLSLSCYGQQTTFPTDVQGNGIGYATTAWKGDATASANPASLAHTSGLQISAAVRGRFLIEGLYDYGLFGSYAIDKNSSIGLQIEHFGFEQFRQQTFAGSFGRNLNDKLSIGLRFSYLLIAQEEQNNASSLSGSIGLLYQLNDQITLGAEVNPFAPAFEDDIELPSAQKLGVSYRPSDIVSVNGDIHYLNNLPNNWSIGVGLTYDIFETVNLALGFRSNPDQFSFGVGWQVSEGLMINISSSFQQRLGVSPMGGFRYSRE
jgi:hypothetical protein